MIHYHKKYDLLILVSHLIKNINFLQPTSNISRTMIYISA